ncbi:hypothetical protein T4E_7802 [Trichinella pseudospiralis]|uniref:Uncharacterized protein n=1 Tax=Trichinella pseudospiralis TaxID=6337 RepID=A0A0V0XH51_TRIPS|nr:hypothetical protein T4E_10322 [Trichinella pseudospiralis]KRX87220.1 hypothetical protein T4E_7802 [Trichinella pseudospiralis]
MYILRGRDEYALCSNGIQKSRFTPRQSIICLNHHATESKTAIKNLLISGFKHVVQLIDHLLFLSDSANNSNLETAKRRSLIGYSNSSIHLSSLNAER